MILINLKTFFLPLNLIVSFGFTLVLIYSSFDTLISLQYEKLFFVYIKIIATKR